MNLLNLKSGTTVEGSEIIAYISEEKAAKYNYLLAGVHGDEVEGVYVLKQILEWMKSDDDVTGPFIIIPILNIDGYRAGTRTNALGIDLNRNLPASNWTDEKRDKKYNPGSSPLSELENIFLDKLFQKFPPNFILTFHSWKPMLNYNGDCKEIADFLEKYNSYPVCDSIDGHPTPGSLGHYAWDKYYCPVLTFECPVLDDNLSLKDIWDENRTGLIKLIQSDLLNIK
jgi:murein peptide amidase A